MTIVDSNGNEIAWVSLKAGTRFRWGGWGSYMNDPDISCWLTAIKNQIQGNTLRNGDSFGLKFDKIKDPVLKNKIVFGQNYGQRFGINNVNMVLIGEPEIKLINGKYVLTGTSSYANGNVPDDEYSPYLVLRYVNDRHDAGFNYARAEANPESEKRKVKWIEPVCPDSSKDSTATGAVSKNIPAKITPAKITPTPKVSKSAPTTIEPVVPGNITPR